MYVNDEIESPALRLPSVSENELMGFASPYVTNWSLTVSWIAFGVIVKSAPVKELIV